MNTSDDSTGDPGGFSTLSKYFIEAQGAAENIRRLLHEHHEGAESGSPGSARYADSIALTVVELCCYGRETSAEEAIEIAEMLPKLLRILWTEIDFLLGR